MGLQKLVSAFENVDFQRVKDAIVGHDLLDIEEGVVPAPKQKARGLMFAMVGLDGWEPRNVRSIVGENLKLDINDTRTVQALPIEMPTLSGIETS